MPEQELPEFEVYQELFVITAWRDDAVYRTDSQGHGWFPESVVKANRPRSSGLIYAAPSDEFSRQNSSIRVRRKAP